MYTKDDLEQLRTLPGEIKLLEERCRELEYNLKRYQTVDSVRGSLSEYPYTEHSITVQGIEDIEGYIQDNDYLYLHRERLRQCREAKAKMEEFVKSIPDPETRLCIEAYYIYGKSWKQVANIIGVTDESTPRRKIKDFFGTSRKSRKSRCIIENEK